MHKRQPGRVALTLVLLSIIPTLAFGEVTRVEIATRTDFANGAAFGSTGAYEQLVGKIYFSVDPANARNRVIVDLDKAPKNAAGRVEMSADLAILKPKDSSKGSGITLLDVVNRGNRTVLTGFNRASGNDMGDGLLMRMGYTIVWVGWEFDIAAPLITMFSVCRSVGYTAMRRFIPPIGIIDITPLAAWLLLQIVLSILLRLI